MKTLILTAIAIISISFSTMANDRDLRTETSKASRKTAVANYSNYKPISKRTFYLEVTRLNNSKVTYRDFLQDNTIISHTGYILEDGKCYKDFPINEKLYGEDKDINRLKNK